MAMSTRDSVIWYHERYGFWSVPVPHKQKGPTTRGWPDLRIATHADVDMYFNGEAQNVAILMGEPRNLADVDIDCEEARWAWIEYALPTGLHWGRQSNPGSHHLYFTEPAAETLKLLDPVLEKDSPGEACIIELRCRTKEGKIGMPVVAPPSIHPTGEAYEFMGSAGFPSVVSGPLLGARVRYAAAAAMLGRHAKEGMRHEIFLALAGAFARAKWTLEEAQRFLRAVYRVIWHDAAQLKQANADVNSTYQHYDDGKDTTGLVKLATLIDERVFKKLKEWLDLHSQDDWMRQQPPPRKAPRVLPESEPIENLRHRDIVRPRWAIEQVQHDIGVGLLVSPPKVGKTVLAMQIDMSIVNGLHLFDYYQNHFAKGEAAALFIEWDDQQAESSIKDFLLKCRASRPDQPLDIVTRPKESFTIADPEFKPWLIAQIRKRPARTCTLDSLTALRGYNADDKTRGPVKLEAGEITMLGEVSLETRCYIRVIHHESKTAAGLDMFSRAAGTYVLGAITESQMVLSRYPGLALDDPTRLLSARGRHMKGLQAVLKFREETLDFDFLFEGEAAQHYPDLRQLLHGLRGRSFDAKQAMDETGWQKTKTYAVLALLTGAGILVKESTSWRWNDNNTWKTILEQI